MQKLCTIPMMLFIKLLSLCRDLEAYQPPLLYPNSDKRQYIPLPSINFCLPSVSRIRGVVNAFISLFLNCMNLPRKSFR